MRTSVKIGLAVAGLPTAVVGLLLARWLTVASVQVHPEPLDVVVEGNEVASILSDLVQIPTVSRADGTVDSEAFDHLHALLESRFPRVHANLERRFIAAPGDPVVDGEQSAYGHSVVYVWEGSDASLDPGALLAHLDVVPVENRDAWSVDPFSGLVDDQFVWGRGTLDDKQGVVMTLAAVEQLLAEGFVPKRTIYLCYGHDEEVSGSGAKAIADTLLAEGVRLAWVLDEGGAIVEGVMDGLDQPVGMIGISEKGFTTLEIIARGTGGHSSMPPPSTAAGQLALAVTRLEARPMPASLSGPTGQMMDTLAPEAGFPMGLVMANKDLLAPVVKAVMSGKPKTNATLRTTTAVTMLEGSVQANVLPQRARAVVNFRVAPGDSAETVLAHVRDAVGEGFEVNLLGGIDSKPSPVSRTEGAAWLALQTAARQSFPEAVVSPYLTLGATDARHYTGLSEHVYRFSPYRVTGQDLDRIHGVDERISIENLARGTGFYIRFLRADAG